MRHSKHFLTARHFTLTTEQKSVAYISDRRHKGKITFLCCILELSCYSFADIVYRPGNDQKDNVSPDTLSTTIFAVSSETQGQIAEVRASLNGQKKMETKKSICFFAAATKDSLYMQASTMSCSSSCSLNSFSWLRLKSSVFYLRFEDTGLLKRNVINKKKNE